MVLSKFDEMEMCEKYKTEILSKNFKTKLKMERVQNLERGKTADVSAGNNRFGRISPWDHPL